MALSLEQSVSSPADLTGATDEANLPIRVSGYLIGYSIFVISELVAGVGFEPTT